MKTEEYIEKLKKAYEPFSDFAGSELSYIDALTKELEAAKDPAFIAFRDNPCAIRLRENAERTYKASKMQLANDDGTLSSQDRLRLHTSALWAQWYLKALGGNPTEMQRKVEAEIERFAISSGVINSPNSAG